MLDAMLAGRWREPAENDLRRLAPDGGGENRFGSTASTDESETNEFIVEIDARDMCVGRVGAGAGESSTIEVIEE